MQRVLASAVLAGLGALAMTSVGAKADVELAGTLRDFHGFHATRNDNGIGVTAIDFDQYNFGPLVKIQDKIANNEQVTIQDVQDVLAIVNQPGGVPAEYLPRFIDVPGFGQVDLQNPPFGLFPPLNAQDQTHKVEAGIVQDQLDINHKPQYLGTDPTPLHKSTHDKDHFDTWFNDVTNVNLSEQFTLKFTPVAGKPGVFGFQADQDSDTQDGDNDGGFFPLDGKLGGDDGADLDGKPHNYSFTLELANTGVYHAGKGQKFDFRGDDDVWVFINDKLALDLGGVHQEIEGSVDLDQLAQQLGLEDGKEFSFRFFYAERNQFNANLKIETSIEFGETPGTTPPPAVPLPPAAWTGLSALAGLGLIKLRSSLKRA